MRAAVAISIALFLPVGIAGNDGACPTGECASEDDAPSLLQRQLHADPAGLIGVDAALPLRVLAAGDSWAAYAKDVLVEVLAKQCPAAEVTNIAVVGSTGYEWSNQNQLLGTLTNHSKDSDYIWLSLMGNDAFGVLGMCGQEGNPLHTCVERFDQELTVMMRSILGSIHQANPGAKLVVFGYDLLAPCFTTYLAPQCDGNVTCWNEAFMQIQRIWEKLEQEFPFVTALNLLGTVQAAGGYNGTSPHHPDLSKWSPQSLFRDCMHPDDTGFGFIMQEMWKLFWSKVPGCNIMTAP